MIAKMLEVRDRATFIPVLAVKLDPGIQEGDRYLLARAGFGTSAEQQGEYILVTKVDGGYGPAQTDPACWPENPRTMRQAHIIILRDFDKLVPGDVVDVEFELFETSERKVSESVDDREALAALYEITPLTPDETPTSEEPE